MSEETPELETFTAREALAFGVTFVKDLQPSGVTQALAVATFLMAYASAYVGLDDADDSNEPGMPSGPERTVVCAVDPGTLAQVVPLASGRVGLRMVENGDQLGNLVFTPTSARAFAAGLLDAADDADGASPLLMFRVNGEGPDDVTPQAV